MLHSWFCRIWSPDFLILALEHWISAKMRAQLIQISTSDFSGGFFDESRLSVAESHQTLQFQLFQWFQVKETRLQCTQQLYDRAAQWLARCRNQSQEQICALAPFECATGQRTVHNFRKEIARHGELWWKCHGCCNCSIKLQFHGWLWLWCQAIAGDLACWTRNIDQYCAIIRMEMNEVWWW